ncbi:MAG: hypothetical protein NW224_15955 [Leptolyngbyaceae cyanobacterium bins.302]|nr:hypothetical protein [Leptolyngbyaceae cyanobacterium bins.302]
MRCSEPSSRARLQSTLSLHYGRFPIFPRGCSHRRLPHPPPLSPDAGYGAGVAIPIFLAIAYKVFNRDEASEPVFQSDRIGRR